MSVIAARVLGGKIEIAADTQVTSGSQRAFGYRKLHQVGSSIMGWSGDCSYGMALKHYLRNGPALTLHDGVGVFGFLRDFRASLQDKYQHGDAPSDYFLQLGMTILVASPGGLFRVSTCLSVHQYLRCIAIGSGGEYALGAMEMGASAEEAVAAACAWDTGCGGRIDCLEVFLKQPNGEQS